MIGLMPVVALVCEIVELVALRLEEVLVMWFSEPDVLDSALEG